MLLLLPFSQNFNSYRPGHKFRHFIADASDKFFWIWYNNIEMDTFDC